MKREFQHESSLADGGRRKADGKKKGELLRRVRRDKED
jgi:hypothetical protein